MEKDNLTVFIHYSWDSEEHKKWVLFLAERLVADGVDVFFDRFDLRIGSNSTYFMEKVEVADKVLIIMTEGYRIKADERKGGVGYEYQIISNEISKIQTQNNKFLPILRQGSREASVPSFLQSFLFLEMTNDKLFEANYIQLLRSIYDEHEVIKPVLGKKPDFKKMEKAVKTAKTKIKTLESIFNLGLKRKDVQKILGEPQISDPLFESYWSFGLQIYYNRHWDKVDGILAKRLPSGISFEDPILGVKLGDPFAEVKAKLGNPINWGLPDAYTSFAFYRINNRYLTIALWRDNPEGQFADFKLGTVTAIGYCEEHSLLACEPIVAVSIEEIRVGKIPTHIEDKEYSTSLVDLNADFFNEPYDILPPQFGLFGGYFITIIFKYSHKIIDFWLYDLGWSTFVIRQIADREELNKEKSIDNSASESSTE